MRKIRSNYSLNGNEYEIKDILRYTYTVVPLALTQKTLNAIEKHRDLDYNTIEIKNYWLYKRNPYNGINANLKSPNGQIFEIQYHTPESYKIIDKMHLYHEKWRLITDKSSREAQELRRSMFELSANMTMPVDIKKVR